MPNEEQQLSSYNFTFYGGPQHVYLFETQIGAGYQVKFKPSGYLVDDPALVGFLFELVIALVENPYAPRLPPTDPFISLTIASIISDFLETNERVIIYICDDSDLRATSRRKLFDRWFNRYKPSHFIRSDIPLAADEDGVVYSVELVARYDNPYFSAVYESFKRVISSNK